MDQYLTRHFVPTIEAGIIYASEQPSARIEKISPHAFKRHLTMLQYRDF